MSHCSAARFVDYELAPREFELSIAQTILRVHTRVQDLFNEPIDQLEQQLRLTIEAMRERQEHELVNNRDSVCCTTRTSASASIPAAAHPPRTTWISCSTRSGRTPASSSRTRKPSPRSATSAAGRASSPETIHVPGGRLSAWRGVPIYPCWKIPISEHRTTSIMVMRTGEADRGVIGLRKTGLVDE